MMASERLRLTRQRRVILEELEAMGSHPTADELYERVRRRLPRVSLGTVYRNLDVLSEHGKIRRLELGGTQRRFDSRLNDHYHVRCTRCGRVDDVPIGLLSNIEDDVRSKCEYDITGHTLEFLGMCPECRREETVSSSRNGVLTESG